MIIERLSQEHLNIEKLLATLERELEVFDRGDRADYEVIHAVISYFEVYPEVYHHPQEDLVFAKLRARDPAAASKVGDLAREHQKGAQLLRRLAQAVDSVLAERGILREDVDLIIRDFIAHERRHMRMEDRDFFPWQLRFSSLKIGLRSLQPRRVRMTRYSATLPRSGLTRCAHIFCGLSRRLTRSVSNRYGVGQCIVPRDAEVHGARESQNWAARIAGCSRSV